MSPKNCFIRLLRTLLRSVYLQFYRIREIPGRVADICLTKLYRTGVVFLSWEASVLFYFFQADMTILMIC